MPATTASSVLDTIQVQDTTNDSKHARDLSRSRKLTIKSQDRAKAKASKRSGKLGKSIVIETHGRRKRASARHQEEPEELDFPVKDVRDDDDDIVGSPSIFSAMRKSPLDVLEVPLLTIIRSPQPWSDGIGTDFELISNPDDAIIALDDDMEYDDDDWDQVNDFQRVKIDDGSGRSYAAVVKSGKKKAI